MTPTKLIALIQDIEGVTTIEQIPVNPSDDNEILVLITFETESDDSN